MTCSFCLWFAKYIYKCVCVCVAVVVVFRASKWVSCNFNFVRRCRTGSATSLAQCAKGCLRTQRVAIHPLPCPFSTVLASFSQFLSKICQLATYYRISWALVEQLTQYQIHKQSKISIGINDPEPWQRTSSLLPPVKWRQPNREKKENDTIYLMTVSSINVLGNKKVSVLCVCVWVCNW